MTEPRVPETDQAEGESTQPIQTRPEPASWYPVDGARPEAEAGAEPRPVEDPDPAGDRPVTDEPLPEPAAPTAEEPTRVQAGDSEPTVVAAEAEPAVVGDEPERTAAGHQPEATGEAAEPGRSGSEPTVVAAEPERTSAGHQPEAAGEAAAQPGRSDSEPTVVVAEPERTVVVDQPEATAVVPEPEPTAVVETPANSARPVAEAPSDAESTAVLPREVPAGPVPFAVGPTESIFRAPSPATGSSPDPEPTRMEQLSDEERKLAAERAARRDARAAALAAPAPQPQAAPEPVIIHKRTNDKFLGSLGLFLLRLVLAGIFAIRGLNLLTDIPAAQAMFARTIIPEPGIMAIVTGAAALLIALSLVLGLLTRLAGLGIALIAGGALAFVYWGNWSPFIAGRPGFLGEYELLLAVVGVLLICIGGGGWSLDRSFRSGREKDKADRAATEG